MKCIFPGSPDCRGHDYSHNLPSSSFHQGHFFPALPGNSCADLSGPALCSASVFCAGRTASTSGLACPRMRISILLTGPAACWATGILLLFLQFRDDSSLLALQRSVFLGSCLLNLNCPGTESRNLISVVFKEKKAHPTRRFSKRCLGVLSSGSEHAETSVRAHQKGIGDGIRKIKVPCQAVLFIPGNLSRWHAPVG